MKNIPATKMAKNIAAKMIELRGLRQLSLQQVADRSGLSKSHIWEIENGNSVNPTISSVVAISNALGVSVDYLIGRSTAMPDLHPEALRIACEIDAILKAA